MFYKLATMILSLALGACVLLAARQMRIQAVHELAAARLRILEADARLWKLRARIAERVTPQNIETMAGQFGKMRPLIFEDPFAQQIADGGLTLDPATGKPVTVPAAAAVRREPTR